jgi:hypothetical protein
VTTANTIPTSAHARLLPDQLVPPDHEETLVLPETTELLVPLAALVLSDPLAAVDPSANPVVLVPRDLLVLLATSAPLDLLPLALPALLVVPVPLVAPEKVAAPETTDVQEASVLPATLAPLVSQDDEETMVPQEETATPVPPEAATTAPLLVWPLDTRTLLEDLSAHFRHTFLMLATINFETNFNIFR